MRPQIRRLQQPVGGCSIMIHVPILASLTGAVSKTTFLRLPKQTRSWRSRCLSWISTIQDVARWSPRWSPRWRKSRCTAPPRKRRKISKVTYVGSDGLFVVEEPIYRFWTVAVFHRRVPSKADLRIPLSVSPWAPSSPRTSARQSKVWMIQPIPQPPHPKENTAS